MRENLIDARKKTNISIQDICKLLNITESYYYKIEKGTRNPSIQIANKIANILKSSVDKLFFNYNVDEVSKI